MVQSNKIIKRGGEEQSTEHNGDHMELIDTETFREVLTHEVEMITMRIGKLKGLTLLFIYAFFLLLTIIAEI